MISLPDTVQHMMDSLLKSRFHAFFIKPGTAVQLHQWRLESVAARVASSCWPEAELRSTLRSSGLFSLSLSLTQSQMIKLANLQLQLTQETPCTFLWSHERFCTSYFTYVVLPITCKHF